MQTYSDDFDLEPLKRLSRDLRNAARTLGPHEVRFLVDTYYQIQDDRKRADSQQTVLSKEGEPSELFSWVFGNMAVFENNIKRALDPWSLSTPPGRWLRSIVGIGPVIASGLLAHIDITRAPTVGHIWRYAGLDPTQTWDKGQKRPWNAQLKVICWKAGQSFMKFQNHPNDTYGQVYVARKALEQRRNEAAESADDAAAMLTKKKFGKDTIAYASYIQGKLPPAQIDARARRYAVKLFLSGLHEALYFNHYGSLPPKPYVLSHLGHANYIAPPNMEEIDGWKEARAALAPLAYAVAT